MKKTIIIIGAGPCGLGAAYRLKELGHRNWTIYEKEEVRKMLVDYEDAIKRINKGDKVNHFGHFPLIFMKNLLYFHTQENDLIYDPFAGNAIGSYHRGTRLHV